MFQENSRTEKFNGVRFYEQDILFDDYIYNGDIQVSLEVDYISPGIGIALMNNEGLPIEEQKEAFLFKLGYRESSVIYRLQTVQKRVSMTATNLVPPVEKIHVTFKKIGKKITVSVDGYGVLIDYTLPKSIDKYNIGVYSNAGNILKSMSIAAMVPDNWSVNMHNTNGGRLKFFKNGFELANCQNEAEIEQQNIQLKKGTYYFQFDCTGDIVGYVMMSGDDRLDDVEKNIVRNGIFKLDTDSLVNVRFKGKSGTVKNIYITDNATDGYVATKNAQATIDGSYIHVNLDNIVQVKWTGKISAIPYADESQGESYVVSTSSNTVTWAGAGILLGKEYSYVLDVAKASLSIYDGKNIVKTIPFLYSPSEVTIFKNMDAVITQFTLIKSNGEVINLIVEKTSKKYVPASITSPIIVIDEDGIPLDMSSSYRFYTENNRKKYVFTNYEREIFEPSTHLQVSKKISREAGAMKVYCIPKTSTYDMSKIFAIQNAGMDNINLFCKKYVTLYEKDLHFVDKVTGDVYIDNVDDYKLIVVDYLKAESYCVNYIGNMEMYEVDISTQSKNTSLLYDHYDQDAGQRVLTTISNYKITDIYPDDKCYIVLRREGF